MKAANKKDSKKLENYAAVNLYKSILFPLKQGLWNTNVVELKIQYN